MPIKTRLARCTKCGKHGHWIFPNGSKSGEFATKGDGLLQLTIAKFEGINPTLSTADALSILGKAGFPELVSTDFLESISSLFGDDRKSSFCEIWKTKTAT